MTGIRRFHSASDRSAAIRRLLDERRADRAHAVRITVSGDHVILDGWVERHSDKDAALAAAMRVGEATIVTDRILVRRDGREPERRDGREPERRAAGAGRAVL